MYKRTAQLFALLLFALFFSILAVYRISCGLGPGLAEAAAEQQTDTLTVAASRGTIYDCHMDALTGDGNTEYSAAVVPDAEAAVALNRILPETQRRAAGLLIQKGCPFTLKLPAAVKASGINVFPVKKRYADAQTAVHVLGYLDGSGKGASGIEKAFDRQLSGFNGKITVTYPVDAVGHILSQKNRTVLDTTGRSRAGVVLTLDRSMQQLAEKAAAKYLKKGAVVVLEVPSGKIRAMASIPAFSPNNVASALHGDGSPMLNRAASAYSVGSVFKIASAAAALEYGISPDQTFTCTGAIKVDGQEFHCFDGESHGKENMQQAITNSCNTYFVHLMQEVPQADFLSMAQKLGFGTAYPIAPGIVPDAGVLPDLKSLSVPRALANFSFGQGTLTATPLQVAAMMNAVASDGTFTQPMLYEGLVDEHKNFTEKAETPKSERTMSAHTASLLRSFMKSSIEAGTSRKGKPDYGTAGAKTATAQTGVFVNGVEQVESWFAGIYPYENPKYVVVVFAEGGDGGGTTCGPVFRMIADGLYGYTLN